MSIPLDAVPVGLVAPAGRVTVVAVSPRGVVSANSAMVVLPAVVKVSPRSSGMSSAYRVVVVVVPSVSTDQVGLSPSSV
jgi:hypothetical protein